MASEWWNEQTDDQANATSDSSYYLTMYCPTVQFLNAVHVTRGPRQPSFQPAMEKGYRVLK